MTEITRPESEQEQAFFKLSPDMEPELQNRNPAAFADFYLNNLSSALFVARRAIRFQPIPDIPEEAVDEGMFAFWNELPQIDFNANWRSKLGTIIHNKALDIVRSKQHRDGQYSTGWTSYDALVENNPNTFFAIEDSINVDQIETRITLMNYIEQLPSLHRQIILLRFFSDASYTQLATSFQEPMSTIKSRLRKALMNLRKLIPAEVKELDFGY